MSVLRLAIPSPLRRLFDYLPPEDLPQPEVEALAPGTRLLVPFGRREVTGYLLEVTQASDVPQGQLKRALAVIDQQPALPADLLQLCVWASNYYHHPQGEVFSAAFPRRLREGKERQPSGQSGWTLTTQGRGLPAGALQRSPKQARALALLQNSQEVSAKRLQAEAISPAVLRTLAEKGLVERCTIAAETRPASSRPGLNPTNEQAQVLRALRADATGFKCHLLEGVTGSGKTEIYLQLITDCLARGQQALVLIPEIGLTPQTVRRFEARFDADIAVLHSGMTEAQRYQSWEAARAGTAHIVIGTRSAVFTPLANAGLIIVDEEHDGSYKQQDGFRYSARDVAVKRGQLLGCNVLLGSATPSLESMHNALSGRYHHHRLTARAGAAQIPELSVLDVRKKPLSAGLSAELVAAIQAALDRGEQALLFLNRRGYAPVLQCHDCGWISECGACDARMTVHRRESRLRCHHCGAQHTLPADCPHCHSKQLLAKGLGTEQTEVRLRELFGRYPVFRVDSDSMQGRDSMAALTEEINRGEPAILLGTQMLTKGHHFPAVTLVAVLDADALLFSADFRGEERMAQLLTQVGGRAGRANLPGRVILQSHYPDHPSVQQMLTAGYAEQARNMLELRKQGGLPPFGQIVVLRADCSDARYTEDFLAQLRQAVGTSLPAGVSLIGPLPSPMQRRAGRHRFQLLATALDRKRLHNAANQLISRAESMKVRKGLKWSVDIDPQDLF
ncbi:MAG: primosomal protein N' [Halioglobus sp.]